ncbi:hypothetical protein [Poritiphilus flavus]|uniref:DUF2268 domain-containing protein n=1 Tax=Poritiphilus flavus TaxID=2697053 RepID=A0A6L9EE59_9FLAO|nr:hypothetical protein [Poritiphilus flavus]NAS12943.1 hypothetical protein [Poritiphilus flavus]
MKIQIPLHILALVCGLFISCNHQNSKNMEVAQDYPSNCQTNEYIFCYTDIENFREVYNSMEQGGDTLAAFESYFKNASPGLQGWISRYNWTPEKLSQRISQMPDYYQSLLNADTELRGFEHEIAQYYDRMKELYPFEFVTIPPTYYFITWGGGGSIELTGNMISVDYFGYHEDLDHSEFEPYGGLFPKGSFPLVPITDIPFVAVHEVGHLFQTYLQGEVDYVSLYTDETKTNMLGYAVREGTADFMAYLVSPDLVDKTRYTYGEAHEAELWELFKPHLKEHPDNNKGWFHGRSDDHPDWPWQIGYYVGCKMIQHYYNQAENKEKAILDILSAKDTEFHEEIAKLYDSKFEP